MDIKSRNIKYSMGAKVFAVILIWLCIMSAVGSSAFLIYNKNIITSKSYIETDKFTSEFSRLVHNVVEFNVKLKSEEDIKASGAEGNVIFNNLNRYNIIKNRLSETINFAYYIKNLQTGETITNVTVEDAIALIQEQSTFMHINQRELDFNFSMYNTEDIKKMLSGTPYEVYATVIEPLKQGDIFYNYSASYSRIKAISTYVINLLIAATLLMIAAFIYLVIVAGRRKKEGEIVIAFPDRIYTDVHTLLVFILAVISVMSMIIISRSSMMAALIGGSIILSIDVFIGLSYVLSMIRQFKNRQVLKNSLLTKIFNKLKGIIRLYFSGKVFKAWTLFLLLGYGGINGILLTVVFLTVANRNPAGFFISGVILLAFNVAVVHFSTKSLVSLTQIMGTVNEISAGNLDYVLDCNKISVAFLGLAEDIQSIQGGLKKAVSEAVKGERMKTDLITNVSHDLKTPLTSIVNYVDLLKKEDLDNEKAYEYINILEEKSARLKQLIDDLVEASKAFSGNIVVNTEKVDFHELVMQACGEYEDKIKKAGLDIRINTTDENLLVLADGKYMWRIVENLISNVLKYSMTGSRVYINLNKNDKYGLLTVKNISAFPLDIPPEQLTERFIRGDESRTTEGSGLGLSIAQSLTNIQGGRFKVEIDGDLFKAIVEIPLWFENIENNSEQYIS